MLTSFLSKAQNPRNYFIGILGFLFLGVMHYSQPHPPASGLLLPFNVASWIPVACLIGIGMLHITLHSTLYITTLTKGLLLAVVILFVPLFYPGAADLFSIPRLYGLLGGFLFFFALQQMNFAVQHIHRILFIVLAGIWGEALFGWVQYLFFTPADFMGFEFRRIPPTGVFRQPNVMASFLASGLVLSAFLLSESLQEDRKPRFVLLFCLLTPLVVVPLLFILNSRAGWLGGIVGTVLVMPFLLRKAGRNITLLWLLLVAIGIGIAVLLNTSADGWQQTLAKVSTDPNRAFIFSQVFQMILQHPLAGIGYGNFESAYNLFTAEGFAAGTFSNPGMPNLTHPHNELLYWAVEGGVLPLAALLYAAYLVARTILACQKEYWLVLVGLFFPIVLHSQTEYPFYHSLPHWIVFLLLIFLVDSMGSARQAVNLKSTLLFGTAALSVPVLTTIFMLTTLHAATLIRRIETVPGTELTLLGDIVNPIVWQDRILWNIRYNLMIDGLMRRDNGDAIKFIEYMTNYVQRKPRSQAYQDLVIAYDLIEDGEGAERMLAEAQFRFPNIEFERATNGILSVQSSGNRLLTREYYGI